MRLARLVIYDGTPNNLFDQLGRSLSDGVRQPGGPKAVTITVVSLPALALQLLDVAATAIVDARDKVAKGKIDRTPEEQTAHEAALDQFLSEDGSARG